MLIQHFPDPDLELLSYTARVRDRERLSQALTEFLAKGSQVVEAKPATEVPDEDLVRLLRARALLGDTLRIASKRLQDPFDRCHALARAHRLPFKVGYLKAGSRI